MTSSTTSRGLWSDLFELGSVPGSSDEARAFMQKRVRLFAGVMAGFGWGFLALYVVFTSLRATQVPTAWSENPPFATSRVFHILASAIALGMFLYTQRGKRPLAAINALDGIGTLAVTACMALMLANAKVEPGAEVESLLIVSTMLSARAAIIPSTPLRTLALGVAAGVFEIAAALHRWTPHPDYVVEQVPMWALGIGMAAWSAVAVAVTVVVSRAIYGLNRRIDRVERLGQYALIERIGEGGMGIVYRASHAMLRRPTAVKLLPPEKAGAKAIARFEREVQLTAKLTHPNTVAIYDYGRTPEGIFYYAMEFLDGVDLQRMVEFSGALPPRRVIHVLAQVAGALGEAHAVGLIHRDVKPANVIVCQRGGVADFVKVVDFGLVHDITNADAASTATGAELLVGTPLYMAPEAITNPSKVDARCDLYALGALGYFLLTGAPVFEAATMVEVCALHLHGDVIPPSLRTGQPIPRGLEALLLACLEKAPERRPQYAEDVLASLRAVDGPAWSPEEANAWWAEHGDAARQRPSSREDEVAFGPTIGVDFEKRIAS